MAVLRLLWRGMLLHVKQLSRSPVEIAMSVFEPLIFASVAIFLFRANGSPADAVNAAVSAGLLGVWATVLFGSGGAVQRQRWLGVLELMVIAPRPLAAVFLPITLASALVGFYAVLATLGWSVLIFGIHLTVANPIAFVAAIAATVASLGMFGMLLASTFVLLPNANALCNMLQYPIYMLSGMIVSTSVLPGWTHWLSLALPTMWGNRAAHQAVDGGAVWPSIAMCLALGGLCLALGAVAMQRLELRARAAATLGLA